MVSVSTGSPFPPPGGGSVFLEQYCMKTPVTIITVAKSGRRFNGICFIVIVCKFELFL
jgi:hypothetical protein